MVIINTIRRYARFEWVTACGWCGKPKRRIDRLAMSAGLRAKNHSLCPHCADEIIAEQRRSWGLEPTKEVA